MYLQLNTKYLKISDPAIKQFNLDCKGDNDVRIRSLLRSACTSDYHNAVMPHYLAIYKQENEYLYNY